MFIHNISLLSRRYPLHSPFRARLPSAPHSRAVSMRVRTGRDCGRDLPPAAERLVDGDDGGVEVRFRACDRVLGLEQRALGVEQPQELDRTLAIADPRELGGAR